METYGDPDFSTHVAMGQYLGLLGYHLATEEIIPFDVTNYETQMNLYLDDLKTVLKDSNNVTPDLTQLQDAIDVFGQAATEATELKTKAEKDGDEDLVDEVNSRFRDFERGFVSQGGLTGREFYKHVIFAPGLDTG
jgi:N-acetylated-alpha-linked acidic dipeptidase